MTIATGNKSGFIRRLALLGKTLADAQPYILADDGDRLTFDIDHPDYPHKSKLAGLRAQSTHAARLPRANDPARWRAAFLYVLSNNYDPGTFDAYARKMADDISERCTCTKHWAIWWRTHPPTPDQPFAWLWLSKNVIATRVGKPLAPYADALAYWQEESRSNALRSQP